jgi:hypothetical protein
MVDAVVVGLANRRLDGMSVGEADGLQDGPVYVPPVGLPDGLPVALTDAGPRADAIPSLRRADWWIAGNV